MRMNLTDITATHDLVGLAPQRAVPPLMADNAFDTGRIAEIDNLSGLAQRERHGFFKGNRFDAMPDAQLDQRQSHVRHGGETQDIGPFCLQHRGSVRIGVGNIEFRCKRGQAFNILVTDRGQGKTLRTRQNRTGVHLASPSAPHQNRGIPRHACSSGPS